MEVVEDTQVEGTEMMLLLLAGVEGAVMDDEVAKGTIKDNDAGSRGRASVRRVRRRRGSVPSALAILLVAVTTWSCTDGSVGLVAPTATEPDPGILTVELNAPAANRDIGVLVELEGPGIETVRAPGFELYESDAAARHQVVVTGSLRPGLLMQFHVPDRNQLGLYRVQVLQVTGDDYSLRDPTEYRAVIRPH